MSPSSTPAVSQPSHSHKIQKLPPSSAPPGFVKAVLDDQAYLIPKFLVPAVFLQINQQRPINEDITVNPGVSKCVRSGPLNIFLILIILAPGRNKYIL